MDGGALPGAVIRYVDSVEHRLELQITDDRRSQAERNREISASLGAIATRLTKIETGISIMLWVGGSAMTLALGALVKLITGGHAP